VSRANVHSSGEANRTVNDKNLAMITHVQCKRSVRCQRREKQFTGDACLAQHALDGRKRIPRAGAIHQNPGLHSASDRPSKRRDKFPTGGVAIENVGAQHDRPLSRIDGRKHLRVSLLAVEQWRDPVPRNNRRFHRQIHQPNSSQKI
jgi:hypothetical protein